MVEQWLYSSVFSTLIDHNFVVHGMTDEGEVSLRNPSGEVIALPCGEGDYLEASVVRHALSRLAGGEAILLAIVSLQQPSGFD